MAAIVYIATNRINGKRYVGATSFGLSVRRRQHERAPNARRATCRYFHAAIKKYGPDAFDWLILVSCETFEDALQQEIRLIATIGPEYNLTAGGQGCKGRAVSQEQRDRSSLLMKGRKRSPESIAKMIATITGRKRSQEQRLRMSEGRKGMKFSPEHRRNISLAGKGKKQTPETIARRAAAHRGKTISPEHREKISGTLRGRKRPPEVVAKMLATRAQTFAARRMEASHGSV